MKSAAIIILTYNNRAEIEACLSSVLAQRFTGKYKVFLVDNNSSDDTLSLLGKFSNIEIIKNSKNSGYAGGNNLGIKQALSQGFDYFVLLNPDTEVAGDWLEQLVLLASAREDAGIVQSKVLFAAEKYRVNTVGNPLHFLGFSWSGGYKTLSSQHLDSKEVTLASGSAMLIKRQVLEKIGLFDERLFMYHEDVDLCWRARLAGYKIFLSPNSKVWHKYSFSFGTKKFFYIERNRLVVLFSNYRLITIFFLLPSFILTEIAMLIYASLTGWFKYKLASWVGFILLVPHIIYKRQQVKKFRKIADKEILLLMTSQLKFADVNNRALKYLYNPLAFVYFRIIKFLISW